MFLFFCGKRGGFPFFSVNLLSYLFEQGGLCRLLFHEVEQGGETLYFHCARDGEKIRAMRENPNVCLHSVARMENCAEGFTVYYASCTIRGIAQEVVDEEERHRALLALCRTFIPQSMDMAEQEIRDLRSVTAVWSITVQEITGKRNAEK